MIRRLGALVLFVVAVLPLMAQEPVNSLAQEDLLRRAHALSANLPAMNRAWLLSVILTRNTRPPLVETRTWAEETFLLSQQIPLDKREMVQARAVSAMARLDPDHALAMLDKIESGGAARSSAAAQVFQAMLIRHGNSVLPKLLETSKNMMAGGSYPFLAMVGLLPRTTPQQRDQIFSMVVDAYALSAPSYRADGEFVQFLAAILPRVSPAAERAGMEKVLPRLLRYAASEPECTGELRFYSDKGVTVLACGDMMLWNAILVLKKADEKAVEKLIAARAALQQPAIFFEHRGGNPMPMAKHAPTVQADRSQEDFDVESIARQAAKTDPLRAAEVASTAHDDDAKVNAMAITATEAAEKDPARARAIIADVLTKVDKTQDLRWKMTIYSNVAWTGEKLGDKAMVENAVAVVLRLGPSFIIESIPLEPDRRLIRAYNGYSMSLATKIGARVSPQSTLDRVNSIQDEEARAYLLLEIADVVGRPRISVVAKKDKD